LADNRSDEDALARRIAAARAAEQRQKAGGKRQESRAWSAASEFIGAMLAGGLIGWFIDRQFGTGPWGILVMLVMGFATGVYQLQRAGNSNSEDKD
jgi:ATP synthase protein I